MLLTAMLATAIGCGSGEPAPVYEPAKLRGEIDANAPEQIQVRQQAIITLFDEIMQRVGAQYRTRDVLLNETDEQFFAGAAYLQSWTWDGPPEGDDLPIRLVLMEDDEQTRHEVTRVYTVTPGRPFAVTRKE